MTGDALDESVFKFHVWEDVHCLDPDEKQPKHNMLPRNSWDYHGIAETRHVTSLDHLRLAKGNDHKHWLEVW